MQSYPLSGFPLYPVKHAHSSIVLLPEIELPEKAGQGEHCLAYPVKFLYVDGGHAKENKKKENNNKMFNYKPR